MVCPKCRLEQADAAECARCGVFVARHRTRPEAVPPPRVAERPADAADAGHGGFRKQARRLNTHAVDTYLRDNVVKVRVNPETSAGAQALADELGVRGFPSFFVMTPGSRPDKMGLRVNGRLRPPSDFIAAINGRLKQQASALVSEGLRLQQQGNVAEATATLAAAIRMRPDDDAPYRVTHEMLGREQRWDEAVACWTSFLERNPSHAPAYLARANALARRGTPGLSRADIRKACELGETQAC